MLEKLHYRRQFILAKSPIALPDDWQFLKIDEYYLYAHPDLDVTRMEDSKRCIVLIGSLFDSAGPEKGNADIMREILDATGSLREFFLWIKKYAGRFALLYKDANETIILHDALSLREIYYCIKDNKIVCGSQPNLVAEFANPGIEPTTNPDLKEFYNANLKGSKWNPLIKWIGDETYFECVNHLLPNHYLDVKRGQAKRYWPSGPIKRLELEDAVFKCCSFLQGNLRAMAHRHPIMMAVTAGTDSRTLLAASRGIQDKIYYFINDQGLGDSHPDVAVPKKIFESIGVPFHVHDVPEDVDEEFRRVFLNNTFFASDRILPTIYNIYFKKLSEKVNILGIGEIGRTRFGKEPRNLSSYRMNYKLGHKKGRYAIKQGEKILSELLPIGTAYDLNVLTLLYWEHWLGNWGVTGNSESDIAIDEINPYDSHIVYETFLGVEERFTEYKNPIIFREMIRSMWPELLEWPINPPNTPRGKIEKCLKEIGVYGLLKELKYQINYAKYIVNKQLS